MPIHPASLDACVQGLGALLSSGYELYLPMGIACFEVAGPFREKAWAVVRLEGQSDGVLQAGVAVRDGEGRLLAHLEGLELRRVARSDVFFQRVWNRDVESRRPAAAGAADESNGPIATSRGRVEGDWLIVPDRTGAAERLADALRSAGATPVVAEPDREVLAVRPWRGIVYLAALDLPDVDRLAADSLAAAERVVCEGVIDIVQRLAARQVSGPTRLCIVTRGAQPVSSEPISCVAGATLWGLARTVGAEHPELGCLCVDIDDPGAVGSIAADLASPDHEVAWRGGQRYVNGLEAASVPIPGRACDSSWRRGASWGTCGSKPLGGSAPGPGQVEIQVDCAGIGFRDVLNVLGMYPGDPGPLGSECVGVITAVGPARTVCGPATPWSRSGPAPTTATWSPTPGWWRIGRPRSILSHWRRCRCRSSPPSTPSSTWRTSAAGTAC